MGKCSPRQFNSSPSLENNLALKISSKSRNKNPLRLQCLRVRPGRLDIEYPVRTRQGAIQGVVFGRGKAVTMDTMDLRLVLRCSEEHR